LYFISYSTRGKGKERKIMRFFKKFLFEKTQEKQKLHSTKNEEEEKKKMITQV
jgi:hypothetical protein